MADVSFDTISSSSVSGICAAVHSADVHETAGLALAARFALTALRNSLRDLQSTG